MDLLRIDGRGLWCERGGFHVDPWAPAPVAVVTHAHADHAKPGSGTYICAADGAELLRLRVAQGSHPPPIIQTRAYGETFALGSVRVSLHPAGHVLGSAQVRVESPQGEVWVVSGDYKRQNDPTCAPFEVVPCDVFISEATFGLPMYRWDEPATVIERIWAWWQANAAAGRTSVLFGYALGKSPRVMAELARLTDRAVWTHGAVESLVACYRRAGVRMLESRRVSDTVGDGSRTKPSFAGELIIAPPSAAGSPWMQRFGPAERVATALASGWMRVRGIRRRRGYDRGFVLSDHADWPALLDTIRQTGARRVLATHGSTDVLCRYLREREGLDAAALHTPMGDEHGEEE